MLWWMCGHSTEYEYEDRVLPGESYHRMLRVHWLQCEACRKAFNKNVILLLCRGVCAVLGVDEDAGLNHDRRGLLTKDNLQDSRDPYFCLTVAPAPSLDGLYTVFGELLEGKRWPQEHVTTRLSSR